MAALTLSVAAVAFLRMKKLLQTLAFTLSATAISPLFAGHAPAGQFVEVHSCEVYTGGCTASAEATLAGRYLLRVWHFDSGKIGDVNLAGLPVALAQAGGENLAPQEIVPTAGIIYVPLGATRAQQTALADWVRQHEAVGQRAKFVVKIAPIRFEQNGTAVRTAIGDAIDLQTAGLQTCEAAACGEALWYAPRSAAGQYTVAQADHVRLREPALGIDWQDQKVRNVFIGQFGSDTVATKTFVAAAHLMP